MTIKKAIKQAINTTSPRWVATKIWGIKTDGSYGSNLATMMIEIQVRKRKGKLIKKYLSTNDVLKKVYDMSAYNHNHDEILNNYRNLHRLVAKHLGLKAKS